MERFERIKVVIKSLEERIANDKKKHLELRNTGFCEVDGITFAKVKIGYIDAPKYWEYVDKLVADYCESVQVIEKTKTTLTMLVQEGIKI